MLRFRWITFDRFKVVNLSRFYRVNFIRPYWVNFTVFSSEAAEVTEMDYGGSAVNGVNSEFDSALGKAQDEVMKLAVMSMTENLCTLSNNTEL